MPNYFYKATDPSGKWVSGELVETTRFQAEARLLEQGLIVESLAEAETKPSSNGSTVSRAELLELVEQLGSLTRSGLPLPSGLRAAGREVTSASLRSTFGELADLIEAGDDLESALRSSGRRFPLHLQGLILAGSRSGRLADVLAEYVRGANLGSELRRMFFWRLAYPVFSLAVVLALVGFVCSLSIKAIDTMMGSMTDFGQERPASVAVLMAMVDFIQDHGVDALIGALLVPLILWATLRIFANAAGRRRLYCSIPVIGPILRFTAMAEFCHLLAMLIDAETPLPMAFELAGSAVRDAEVAEACGRLGREVEEGELLSVAIQRWDSIPAGLGQLFRWSEDRRNLPEALHLAGDMFESRARSQSQYASSVISTFLLLLIIWLVGFAIATLYLPMVSLISRLSG